jgi:membrane glycosyltransferase
LLLLFLPLFGWVAFGFVGATIGFVLLMGGNVTGFADPAARRRRIGGRTAVLMPIYEEDVSEVFGRIAAMIRSIAHTPGAPAIDFFVLSDSGPAAGEREHSAWAALAVGSPVPLYYRRREKNVARKPGNLAEWVRRFGGAYDYMTVLDADSLMSGPAIVALSDAMEARPAIGLIQTVPLVIGATTVFQRWMQFANRLYGPIASAGLLWWWGGEASFWGHNAIVRVAAFAESCGLPELPGKPPFGGHVMSHDIIEAALLRRRGWSVHTITVNGSYEEHPPTLVDHAIRDRRWAQGNIQHVPLLGSAGFHWISRLQMLVGASAYATSSLWLLLILTTLAQQFHILNDAAVAASTRDVLLLTIALLFGPKLMALIWAMSDPVRRQSFGGTGPLLRSVAAEIMLSILMAPVAMLTQTFVIVQILRGKRSDWAAQARGRAGIPIGEAIGLYRWHLALGAVFLLLAPLAPGAAAWLDIACRAAAGRQFRLVCGATRTRRSLAGRCRASPLGLIGGAEKHGPINIRVERFAKVGTIVRRWRAPRTRWGGLWQTALVPFGASWRAARRLRWRSASPAMRRPREWLHRRPPAARRPTPAQSRPRMPNWQRRRTISSSPDRGWPPGSPRPHPYRWSAPPGWSSAAPPTSPMR